MLSMPRSAHICQNPPIFKYLLVHIMMYKHTKFHDDVNSSSWKTNFNVQVNPRRTNGQTRTLYAPYFRRRGIQIVHHDVICCDCARSIRIVKVVKHSQNKHTKLTAILQYMERQTAPK